MSKKCFISLAVLFFSFFLTLPAEGIILEEIREDLRELKEKTEDLVEDAEDILQEREPATFPDIPDDFRFAKHLKYNMYDTEVMYLQRVLNADPDTRLAENGVGSSGNEVKRFGNITKNAVIKFQEKYAEEILYPWGIQNPTGYVGIQTIKKLNSILDGETVIEVVPPERRRELEQRILEIIQGIQDLRKKLGDLGDVEEGAVDAPYNIRGAIIAYGEVRLTWRGDRDADYFTAYLASKSGGSRTVYGDTAKTSGIVKGLEEGETYYITITQTVDGKESGHSREVKVTMDWDPTPFNIRAEATDIGELFLTWESDQRDVEEYRIYRAQKSGGPYKITGISTDETFKDTGLGLQTIYYYAVTQLIDGEESDFSGEYVDSWFYNWQGGSYPHPEKEEILENLDYDL